jgi:hypothetical protein
LEAQVVTRRPIDGVKRVAQGPLQPAPVHAVIRLQLPDSRLDGLAPSKPGLLLRGQALELVWHVLQQVGRQLEHGAEDVAVVEIAEEAARAHHQPALVRDHHFTPES